MSSILLFVSNETKNIVRYCSSTIAGFIWSRQSTDSLSMEEEDTSGPPDRQVLDLTHKVKTLTTEAVAQGGFSDVYRGELEEDVVRRVNEAKSQVVVAIKLLRCFTEGKYDFNRAKKRLYHEVDILARAAHPNVVQVFGISYHMGGRPAIIMPWYHNGNVREYLQVTNPGARADKLKLIRDVIRGLCHLHSLTPPIMHGDLKANNILIADDGRAVLCDLGSSRALEGSDATTTGTTTTAAASLRWQAPEHLLSDEVRPTPFSEIWSFACTACEIFLEKVPYSHRNQGAMVVQDILRGVKPFELPRPTVSVTGGSCCELFRRCWNYFPAARPSTEEVRMTLESDHMAFL